MPTITLYTLNNFNIIKCAFPNGSLKNRVYRVWIDKTISVAAINAISNLNPYLGQVLRNNADLFGYVEFNLNLRLVEDRIAYAKLYERIERTKKATKR